MFIMILHCVDVLSSSDQSNFNYFGCHGNQGVNMAVLEMYRRHQA